MTDSLVIDWYAVRLLDLRVDILETSLAEFIRLFPREEFPTLIYNELVKRAATARKADDDYERYLLSREETGRD